MIVYWIIITGMNNNFLNVFSLRRNVICLIFQINNTQFYNYRGFSLGKSKKTTRIFIVLKVFKDSTLLEILFLFLDWTYPLKEQQWAAVMTKVSLIKLPPHLNSIFSSFDKNPIAAWKAKEKF